MSHQQLVMQVLTQLGSSDVKTMLKWVEISRNGPKAFFGKKPDDELDPKYFIEPDGSPRIPPDIGDSFQYSIQTAQLLADFTRQFYNTSPLSAYHALFFRFGNAKTADHPLAFVQGLEFLAEAKLAFYSGRHGTPPTVFSMETQGLNMHKVCEWGEDYQFTEDGNRIMRDFLANIGRIAEIPGLREEDKKSLIFLLQGVEQQYNLGLLEPREWFYT